MFHHNHTNAGTCSLGLSHQNFTTLTRIKFHSLSYLIPSLQYFTMKWQLYGQKQFWARQFWGYFRPEPWPLSTIIFEKEQAIYIYSLMIPGIINIVFKYSFCMCMDYLPFYNKLEQTNLRKIHARRITIDIADLMTVGKWRSVSHYWQICSNEKIELDGGIDSHAPVYKLIIRERLLP